jgi:cytochrome c-type protein NrfB
MKSRWLVAIVLASAFFLGAKAMQNKGATQITIEAGERGPVHFPHHLHQDKLGGDCKICHSLFPQEPHAIEKLKKEGKLARKQIMNKLCVKCHKARRRAGEKAGPVTCSKCHHRG